MRLSQFGKELRKHRVEIGVRLNTLAKEIGVSSSFLSAVETGAKSPSIALVDLLGRALELSDADVRTLHELAARDRKSVSVDLEHADTDSRALATAFARKFNSLSQEQIHRLFTELGDD